MLIGSIVALFFAAILFFAGFLLLLLTPSLLAMAQQQTAPLLPITAPAPTPQNDTGGGG